MANEANLYTGFMEFPPILGKTKSGQYYAQFILVIKDSIKPNSITKIPCLIIGERAEMVSIKGIRGTLWTVKGKWYWQGVKEHLGDLEVPLQQLLVYKIELHSTPLLSGIGLQEFTKAYSPTAIIKRRKQNARKEKKGQ